MLPVGRKYPYKLYYPFEGSAIASFERSTLPEHAGRCVAVMRIKRFLDSDPIREVPAPNDWVYPVDALRPREGELAFTIAYGKVRPCAVDVNHKFESRKAFKILFDNEEMYGPPRET
ncbi:hypothetical protein GSI_10013 [Ganoderma sinense ZZ0214-1]|uniref:Uncharacterized protein n=1 Tax=Ganoderma sinense ZZ0214-1 TaxID=1077348 RepID=A0A2G8S2B1_9APHY|nr:hypothetical protein GSI_10013 [Ganoderma sinense ZZ0214-1]